MRDSTVHGNGGIGMEISNNYDLMLHSHLALAQGRGKHPIR
jgi:hypothetical protein